jgi:hypothetical protein
LANQIACSKHYSIGAPELNMNGIEQQAMPIQAISLNWNLFYNTSSTKLFFVNYNFF